MYILTFPKSHGSAFKRVFKKYFDKLWGPFYLVYAEGVVVEVALLLYLKVNYSQFAGYITSLISFVEFC